MNIIEFKRNYLNHYSLLEQDFKETIEYVTISEDNYNTYSVSYLKLLLTIGSEIDVMIEFLASIYEPEQRNNGFGGSKVILENEPEIKQLEIEVIDDGIIILPWECEDIPEWWTAYNEIKHNRYKSADRFDYKRKYYQYANLKNVISALAALFSLELYAYRVIAIKSEEKVIAPVIKSIFTVKNSHWKDIGVGNGYVFCNGELHL